MLWKKNYIRNYKSRDNNHTCDICLLAVWGDGDDSDRATAVLDLMFEATSAMATVGLTADLTPVLSDISHVVLMLMMYIGRIGPMTMALIFSGHVDKKNQFRTLPEAKIMVG